jgi:peptide deformylase
MALRSIITVPDKVLARKAEIITDIGDEIRKLAADMAETMYKAPGIGLAANQIGELCRLIVLDVVYPYAGPKEKKKKPVFIINPQITHSEGETMNEEGCLSVPEFGIEVQRFSQVQVEGVDLDGNTIKIEADGLLARALQHEIDHLNGITILDHASALKRSLYVRRLKKKTRRGE